MSRRKPKDAGLAAAIAVVGKAFKLAEQIGVTPQAVASWKKVPWYRVLEIERITGVSRHVLRPDIYPTEDGDGRSPPSNFAPHVQQACSP
jgi:DNA-binding transcriptional regulator YdaS (Cro superfamily)